MWLGQETVDEIKIDDCSIFDKLFSVYALQRAEDASDDVVYLCSEHDVDFMLKKQKRLLSVTVGGF